MKDEGKKTSDVVQVYIIIDQSFDCILMFATEEKEKKSRKQGDGEGGLDIKVEEERKWVGGYEEIIYILQF